MEGYGAGTLSGEDEIAFFQWYSEASLEEVHRIFSLCNLPAEYLPRYPQIPANFRRQLEQEIRDYEMNEAPHNRPAAAIVPLFRRYRLGWAAAILLLISAGGYLLYHSGLSHPEGIVNNHRASSGDAAPGTTKAVLTLADGSQIILDSARSGQLAVQGMTTVENNHGAVSYDGSIQGGIQKNIPELLYNTLTTSRGEQSPTLTLSDGTKVWLNAQSSIRFPVTFSGNVRNVEITGEAFFEVARNASKPFHVIAKGMDVEVLGTQFNINAYSDEPDVRTTLLEGRVKIVTRGESIVHQQQSAQSLILERGQQASVDGGISMVANPDIDQVMAWKSGLFDFNHASLQTVLRQLSRWYDIDVKFEGSVPVRSFQGKINRDQNLSQVIRMLEYLDVKFRIEGKTLIVLQ